MRLKVCPIGLFSDVVPVYTSAYVGIFVETRIDIDSISGVFMGYDSSLCVYIADCILPTKRQESPSLLALDISSVSQ